jgi:hypothetical protein
VNGVHVLVHRTPRSSHYDPHSQRSRFELETEILRPSTQRLTNKTLDLYTITQRAMHFSLFSSKESCLPTSVDLISYVVSFTTLS